MITDLSGRPSQWCLSSQPMGIHCYQSIELHFVYWNYSTRSNECPVWAWDPACSKSHRFPMAAGALLFVTLGLALSVRAYRGDILSNTFFPSKPSRRDGRSSWHSRISSRRWMGPRDRWYFLDGTVRERRQIILRFDNISKSLACSIIQQCVRKMDLAFSDGLKTWLIDLKLIYDEFYTITRPTNYMLCVSRNRHSTWLTTTLLIT